MSTPSSSGSDGLLLACALLASASRAIRAAAAGGDDRMAGSSRTRSQAVLAAASERMRLLLASKAMPRLSDADLRACLDLADLPNAFPGGIVPAGMPSLRLGLAWSKSFHVLAGRLAGKDDADGPRAEAVLDGGRRPDPDELLSLSGAALAAIHGLV